VIPATLVEGKELLDTVLYSLVAGVGLTLVFSVAVWGVTRFSEFSRDERHLAAGAAAALSLLALAAAAGAVILGIVVVAQE
jgi:cation transporter-like permease